MKQLLSIIIVTHNSAKVIANCLEELKHCEYELIIVDCNSSDNSLEIVKNSHNNVKIIPSRKNLGYGRANNLGAQDAQGEYLLFLNPDATIKLSDIKKVLTQLNNHPKLGIAGVEINTESKDYGSSDELFYTNWIMGACLFIRKKLFYELDGFDKNIFLYGDENDLCGRARKLGYEIAIVKQSKAEHINFGSCPQIWQYDYLRGYHQTWSKLYLRKKKKGIFKTIYIIPKFFCKSIIKIIISVIKIDKRSLFWNLGGISGNFNFILGRSAFDHNDNPRGMHIS